MAKAARSRSGQFVSVPRNQSITLVSPPRAAPRRRSSPKPARTKGRRGRRRHYGKRSAGGIQKKVMDYGWALLALDFAAGAIGDKLPIIVADAGKEGSLALAAYFFDADKYVSGVEDVAIILALRKFLENSSFMKPAAGKEGAPAGGGFNL